MYIKLKQENRWKRRMLDKWLLSIKGKTCNPTPLVHQDMIKKATFYLKINGEIIKVILCAYELIF